MQAMVTQTSKAWYRPAFLPFYNIVYTKLVGLANLSVYPQKAGSAAVMLLTVKCQLSGEFWSFDCMHACAVDLSVAIDSWWVAACTKPSHELIFLANFRNTQLALLGCEAEEFWNQMVSVFMTSQVCLIDEDQSVKQYVWNHQGDKL